MFIKNQRLAVLALGLMPLVISVGCLGKFGKKSEQEEIAELEKKLAALKGEDAATPAPEPVPEPEPVPVLIPRETRLPVSLSGSVSTNTHQAGDTWVGQLLEDVYVNGTAVWGAGTRVSGTVTASAPTGRLSKGNGILAIKLTQVGDVVVEGSSYSSRGEDKAARNTKIIGTTATLGALTGMLSDKRHKADHGLGGAVIGAGVGTGVAAATANTAIYLPSKITFKLLSDVSVLMVD